MTIRLRLTLWYSALLTAALVLFSVAVYLVMADTLVSNLDASLAQRIAQVQGTAEVTNGRLQVTGGSEPADAAFIPTAFLLPTGKLLSGQIPTDIRRWADHRPPRLTHRLSTTSVGAFRLAEAPITDGSHIVGYVLAWQPLGPIEEARRSLLLIMGAIGPILLSVAGLGGFVLARRALRPVAQVTRTARSISAMDLHRRVSVGSAQDELSELAGTFNAMIDRLEAAVQRERRFTADASHELRSPLAVIQAEASLALERVRSPSEYQRALTVIDEQAGAMEELIGALLLLARVETLKSIAMEDIPVEEVVTRAVQQCKPMALQNRVVIDISTPPQLRMHGAPALLTRAVRNLLDNAIKFSPPNATVHIRAYCEGDCTVVAVEDRGPGIAEVEQERIFDPFYQVSVARTPGDSHGLGLAICRRIADAHRGDLRVMSLPGHGSIFTIAFPST